MIQVIKNSIDFVWSLAFIKIIAALHRRKRCMFGNTFNHMKHEENCIEQYNIEFPIGTTSSNNSSSILFPSQIVAHILPKAISILFIFQDETLL